jgi:hypothetical protein
MAASYGTMNNYLRNDRYQYYETVRRHRRG